MILPIRPHRFHKYRRDKKDAFRYVDQNKKFYEFNLAPKLS